MGRNFKWTQEKILLLEQYYPVATWEELYQILGNNNKTSIITQASKRGISRDVYQQCKKTPQEVDFILANYTQMTATEMAHFLNRDTSFVCNILQDHHLRAKTRIRLHAEDEELFKQVYPKYSNKMLHEKFFPYLSASQIGRTARRLGVVKSVEKGSKHYDATDILEKLEQAIKVHGRVPMILELQEWGLPSEKTFMRYFGGLTKACELIGIVRPVYLIPIVSKTGVLYDKRGNVCLSKSEQLISNFLIEHQIDFEKDPYYKTVIPYERCGEKRFDWRVGDKYIEFFGLTHYKNYDSKTQYKIQLCQEYNIKMLPLEPQHLKTGQWQQLILDFLNIK